MSRIMLEASAEELRKIDVLQSRLGLPSKELTVRKIIELFPLNPGTR